MKYLISNLFLSSLRLRMSISDMSESTNSRLANILLIFRTSLKHGLKNGLNAIVLDKFTLVVVIIAR